MSRIVCVWLKSWPIARLLRVTAKPSAAPSDTVDPRRPLVLVSSGAGGARIVALNGAAWRSGLAVGDLLSNAHSKVLDLQSRDADPAADEAALRQLALWCLRYTPVVMPWSGHGGNGLFLDITGCAHLFGGEPCLLADLAQRLRRFGLHPCLAVADTAGAAWAVARYPTVTPWGRDIQIIPPGEQGDALRELPLAALRLDEDTQATLCRLGFRRIGELMRQPRAPLAARFGAALLTRLDQALGREAEPLAPLEPPPCYRVHAPFAEAIMLEQHVIEAAARLLHMLMPDLERDGAGVRVLRLLLFRLDGDVLAVEIGLAAPSRDVQHIARLIAMRLERLPLGLEADFGFEAAALHVLAAERIAERQASLGVDGDIGEPTGLVSLIDRLEHRLGTGAVRRLHPRQSYIPERAVVALHAAEHPAADWREAAPFGPRPPLLLAEPEQTDDDVLASVPDGPPKRFRWRGVQHDVAHVEGPERIAPEWWHPGQRAPERDYYVVEDTAGRRFWLFRAGRYVQGAEPVPGPLVVLSGAKDLAVDPSQTDGAGESPAPPSIASTTARSFAPLRTTEPASHANTSRQASPTWFIHGVFP
ncbi:MAG TPA: DNA polymerase Y family protein [Vineibacter sp.]|nr:DNA polymerase Y family protein [Vineibacter sp.]